MRNLAFTLFLFFIMSALYGQTGYDYLARLPVAAGNVCSMSAVQQKEFLKTVRQVIDELNKQILEKKKRTKSDIENQKDQIEKNMAAEYGLSNSDIQKMKNKKLSKEEKKAIADKMMQEKTGISMAEIDQLKKMSKEGKKQWAEAYATQQQANLSGNPDSNKTAEQIAMEKEMAKNAKTGNLAKEQQKLVERIAASDKKFTNKMNYLIKEDSVALIILKKGLKPLEDRLNALPGPSEEEAEEINDEMRALWLAYCNKISPIYVDILGGALENLKAAMPNYDRLEELNEKLSGQTVGLKPSMNSKGLMQLEAVKSYAGLLLNTFNYGAKQAAPKLDSND